VAARRDHTLVIALAGALGVHAALAGGVGAASYFGLGKEKKSAPITMFEVVKEPEPPPPPPEPEPEPEPPPREDPPPPEPEPRKVTPPPPRNAPPPKPDTPPDPEPPAPGPVSEEPPTPYTYRMPSSGAGSMGVAQGTPSGTPGQQPGRPGQDTKGTGGGGPPDSAGTGVASAAAIAEQPKPLGDYDRLDPSKYPAQAKQAGIEGKVLLRLVIDEDGQVVDVSLKKGLGHGLDQVAMAEVKKIRFKPAIDTNGKAVKFAITWTFNFELPR
jgi:protein TonB